jgi:hypothetical protein
MLNAPEPKTFVPPSGVRPLGRNLAAVGELFAMYTPTVINRVGKPIGIES